MSENLQYVGEDFVPPDARPKVTGAAKYADDYLFDDLLHAKTVKSPYAHAEVVSIDASAAESMSGVEAVITYEDVPDNGVGEPALDGEPKVFGYPVAAVAATDEYTAAAAVEAIDVEYRVLDHVIDPVETLKPDGPNARLDGNAPTGEAGGESAEGQGGGTSATDVVKWGNADFSTRFPENPGDYTIKWSWGDVESGFEKADAVVEDTVETQPIPTNPMEPRSTVAHWEGSGKVTVWGSSQSISLTHTGLAGYLGVAPPDLHFICNYCGGGFGSKGTWYAAMGVPAFLSKEVNRPVKLRGTRKEEFHWGNGRTSEVFKFRIGATEDGTITALDVQAISNAGAYGSDALSGASASLDSLSAVWQPETMRARAVGVFTNTPKRWPMRGPGENQAGLAISQVIDQLADELGVDPLELRRSNTATKGSPVGANRAPLTSANLDQAYDMAAEAIGYDDLRGQSGSRDGSTVRGVGIGAADHASGYVGFDGLVVIHTDGTVEVRQGAGNLGTESYAAVARMVAETMDVPWDQVEVNWGDSAKSSFTLGQFSSNTTFTTGLANVRAAETAVQYLKELGAREFGGDPEDFEVADGRVTDGASEMTLGAAAQAAVDAGGKYSGEEVPEKYQESLVPLTLGAAAGVTGQALVAFGKTTGEDLEGTVRSQAGAIAEVSVDVETGKVSVENIANYCDSGRVVHPESHSAQIEGATVQGVGYALSEHYLHDEDTGIPLNTDFYKNKPPSIYDYSANPPKVGGVGEPDPFGPHGAKGVGEPPYGSAAAAVASAVGDALGTTFETFPITPSAVLEKIENGETEVER